jgi:hypothetical protein
MAKEHRREERDAASVTSILFELLVDSIRLGTSLVMAPVRILEAMRLRRSRRAEA